MGNLERGSVASFRVPDAFNNTYLEHLNSLRSNRSQHIANLCLKGIKVNMANSIVIDGEELSVEAREWLSNKGNIEMLIKMISNYKIVKGAKSFENKKASVVQEDEEVRKTRTEMVRNEVETTLEDFILTNFK